MLWAVGIAPVHIVYFAADAPTRLTAVTPGTVYTFGGMVDRNRLRGAAAAAAAGLCATAAAAAGLRVATAALDVGPAGCRGTRVPTILHAAALLAAVANGATWAEAVADVLSPRNVEEGRRRGGGGGCEGGVGRGRRRGRRRG